ncbi:class I SAM-dependent methyltransferase [Singulisphaera rosea]
MSKKREVPMPEAWNDHAGWNAHYESRFALAERAPWDEEIGSIGAEELPSFAEGFRSRGWMAVWVPGCGLSPLARLLAHLGLQVVATDVSSVAVRFQQSHQGEFAHLIEHIGPPDPAGSFAAERHDFRDAFRREAFDLILNVKSFQAFPVEDMARIARFHAEALRGGRYAYFDTMNIQGERRDQLEQALEGGGFAVPLMALNRWYRLELHKTQIPHIFVLGQPIIPRVGEYAEDDQKRDRDMARLREISEDYRNRLQAEQGAERQRLGPKAKVAHVIYSTG